MSKDEDIQWQSRPVRSTSSTNVCIVGVGYVGLSVALAFDRRGANVTGYDVSKETISDYQNGTDPTQIYGDEAIESSEISFTGDPSSIGESEHVIIAVPTPVDSYQTPDLKYVESAGEVVGSNLARGATVVLESTVFPGATREALIPAIERNSGFTAGEDFAVGYSPERISPGDSDREIHDIGKVVSGYDDEATRRIAQLYEQIIDADIYTVPSIEVAEMVKVFENVQRGVNIALVNELAIVCEHLGISVDDVLDGAATKWNFQRYEPGLVGGHCIPVDPMLYLRRSEREGYTPNLVLMAREVNNEIVDHIADKVVDGLNQCGKVLKDSRLLVLGLSYKANVGDIRNSKIGDVIDDLQEYGVDVDGYDPHANDDAMRSQFDIDIQDSLSFEGYDGVLLATGHDAFTPLDLNQIAYLMEESPLFVDLDGIVDEGDAEANGFVYRGF